MPNLSVVVPIRNEAELLPSFLEAVLKTLDSVGGESEVIFVDDGSTDSTWQEVVRLAGTDPRVNGVRLSRNFGKEAALYRGLQLSRGRGVVTIDGDLEHPPSLIPRMVELWRSGARIVNAVRVDRGARSWAYRAAAALFDRAMATCTGLRLEGATDFKLLDRQAVEAVLSLPERTTFFRGICAWVGFPSADVCFEVEPSRGRRSRWRWAILARYGLDALTSFSAAPLLLFGAAGLAFIALSGVLGLQTLYNYFSGRALTGFTTVILVSLAIGGMNLLGISVIGLYLSRVFTETKGRPRSVTFEVVRTPAEGDDHDPEGGAR